MKTVFQNICVLSTSIVTALEDDQPQLVAILVPHGQRISFWSQYFSLIPQWVTLEPHAFGWADHLCEDYCDGIWNLYTPNNGEAFMAPELDDDDDETWILFSVMGGNRVEIGPEAADIATCLMAYGHHACHTECCAMMARCCCLQNHALQRSEYGAIMRTID